MAIQLFDLGPPRVDTFSSISSLGKSFFDAFDRAKKNRLEEDAGNLATEWGKGMLSGGSEPAAPPRSIAEIGKTTPNGSADLSAPNLPTFARPETGQQLAALKSIESSNRYGIIGPTHPRYGRALGAYQIMEANLPQWSREALGREVTPDEFLANPRLQDTIAAFKFQQYVDKFGNPQDAASAWLTGRPMAQAGGRRDAFGTDAPEYVRRFNAALARAGGQPQGRVQTASLSPGMGYAPDTPPMRVPWDGSPMQAQPAVNYRSGPETGGAAVAEPLWGDGSLPEHYRPQPVRTAALPPDAVPGVPGATDAPGIGALPPGLPTMPGPQATPAPRPQPAPAPAPPVQVAQAPTGTATDALPQSFQKLAPARQQLLVRMLQNPLTRQFAMQQIEALRKQDEWSYQQAPNGQLIRTSKSGRIEAVPGFEKPQDRFVTETDAQGNTIQRNTVTDQRSVLTNAPDQWSYSDAGNGVQIGRNTKTGKIEAVDTSGKQAPEQVRKLNDALANWKQYRLPDPSNPANAQWWQDFSTKTLSAGGVSVTINDEVEQRKKAASAAGLKPDDPRYQGFILTGQMPRENQRELSQSDKKAILEAEDQVMAAETAVENLTKAKELSKKAWGFKGAGQIGGVLSPFNQGAADTTELDNLVQTNAVGQLKAIFGGNPTEGERAILLELEGSSSKPDAIRQKIYDRAIKLAQRRLELNRARAEEMRGGSYFKPKTGEMPKGQDRVPLPEGYASAAQFLNDAKNAVKSGGDRKWIENELRIRGIDPKRLDD